MPIYEYSCTACGHDLEALQKISDDPLKECPECHNHTLVKKVSAPPFHLKGSGWYVTDFRDKGKKPEANKEASKSTEKKGSSSD